VTRRSGRGSTWGLAVAGRQLFAAPFGRKSYGAAAAAHGTLVTGRCGPRRIPLPRSPAPRPGRHRCARYSGSREDVTAPGRNAAHCPGWPLQPQRCFASRYAGRACGAPLTPETSASPAGLTARARPEARPETRAANLESRPNYLLIPAA
jgi:hypothetical protein